MPFGDSLECSLLHALCSSFSLFLILIQSDQLLQAQGSFIYKLREIKFCAPQDMIV